jgi:hypothetical protein
MDGKIRVFLTSAVVRGENSCPYRYLNPDPSVFQPVASRHTDCVTAAPLNRAIIYLCFSCDFRFVFLRPQ